MLALENTANHPYCCIWDQGNAEKWFLESDRCVCVCGIHKDLKDKHQEPATNLFFVPVVIKKQCLCAW